MTPSLRSKATLAAFLLAALAAGWLGWRFLGDDEAAAVPDHGASTGYVATGDIQDSNPATAASPAVAPAEAAPNITSYYEQFRTSNDLAPFALAMHKQALEGDDAAQYWLARVLKRCGMNYDAIFNVDPAQPDKPPLSLDEALADEEANPNNGAEEIRELHGQCQRFREMDRSQFGNADVWLRRAAQTGYPAAQIWRAKELALDVSATSDHAEARALMLAALRSGDPEVVLEVGSVARELARTESQREKFEWVWEVAACQRGADCGPTADWVRTVCAIERKCQPYDTAMDFIRRRVGAQMPEIEEQARKLNAHIDAREWDELGL